ncbi:unnamed protein product, partial [marine sediment metagenome]
VFSNFWEPDLKILERKQKEKQGFRKDQISGKRRR